MEGGGGGGGDTEEKAAAAAVLATRKKKGIKSTAKQRGSPAQIRMDFTCMKKSHITHSG